MLHAKHAADVAARELQQAKLEAELEARLKAADLEAKLEAAQQRLAELVMLDEMAARTERAERAAACARAAAESSQVWGADHASRPTGKVFSFVGKSAAEVSAEASQVSQERTSTEERVRLNKFSHSLRPPSRKASTVPV